MSRNLLNPDDKSAILQRISAFNTNSLRQWGTMTPQEMLCHTADQLRVATGKIDCQPTGNVFHKTFLKWLLLAGVPFPKGKAQTMPEINTKNGSGTQPLDFKKDQEALEREIIAFIEMAKTSDLFPHPIFGKMSNREWGRIAFIHLDYHFQQFSG